MSQIHLNDGGYDFSHYENDKGLPKDDRPTLAQQIGEDQKTGQQPSVRRQSVGHEPPVELSNARPAPKSSRGWSKGRIAACIITAGFSELLRLAWRGIMSCCTSARLAPAQAPRIGRSDAKDASDPLPTSASYNENVGLALLARKPLHGDLEGAAREALAELRGQFGVELVPEGKSLKETLGTSGTNRLYAQLQGLQNDVTPAQIREWVLQAGKTKIVMQHVADKMKELWPEGTKFPVDLPDHALSRYPELKESLMSCTSPGAIRSVLEGAEAKLQAIIAQKQRLDAILVEARHWYVEALGKGLGAPYLAVSDMDLRPFNNTMQKFANAILTGSHPGCLEEGFDAKKAIRDHAEDLAGTRVQEYESIRLADISDDLRNTFRHMLLTNETVKPGSLALYIELGSKVDASRLMEILSDPEPDPDALRKEMLALGSKLSGAFLLHFGGKAWHDLDGDVKGAIQAYAPLVMLDKVPGLRKALAEYPALPELSEWCSEQMDTEDHPVYGIRIANVAGIARGMISSAGEVDIRLRELGRLGG
ncbi:MAG: hypothetical protein II737_03230 [Mailhella sp.]|nr:hypothetical protein [Mailhella sp.]